MYTTNSRLLYIEVVNIYIFFLNDTVRTGKGGIMAINAGDSFFIIIYFHLGKPNSILKLEKKTKKQKSGKQTRYRPPRNSKY